MSVQTVSVKQTNNAATNSAAQSSTWKGRSVIVVDKAYNSKQEVRAGGGAEGIGKALDAIFMTAIIGMIVIPPLVAFAAATLITGSSTVALQAAGVTLLVEGAIFLLDRCTRRP